LNEYTLNNCPSGNASEADVWLPSTEAAAEITRAVTTVKKIYNLQFNRETGWMSGTLCIQSRLAGGGVLSQGQG